MSNAKEINQGDFAAEVLQSDLPVVVDFFTTWCGPCKMLGPLLDQLAAKYAGRIKVVKVNAEREYTLANEHQIQGVPTLVFYRGGKEVDRVVGLEPTYLLEKRFDRHALTLAKSA